MKNRNKRFTSVVAASMALAAIAPVAPVLMNTPVFAEEVDDVTAVVNGIKYSDPTVIGTNAYGEPIYGTTIVGFVTGQLKTNLTLGGTVSLPLVNPMGQDEKVVDATVTSIANDVFAGNDTLVNVTVTGSISNIGGGAFANCPNLKTVTYAYTGTGAAVVGGNAFAGCSSLNTVVMSGKITTIDDYAFYNDAKLSSVTLPESLVNIGNFAFLGDSALTTIEFPATLATIGNRAFYDTNLTGDITIPDSVVSVKTGAFGTIAPSLSLYVGDMAKLTSWQAPVFLNGVNRNNFKIYGTISSTDAYSKLGADIDYYVAAPKVSYNTIDTDGRISSTSTSGIAVTAGTSFRINVFLDANTNNSENSTVLYINDNPVATYTKSNNAYTWTTPTVGTYKVYAVNAAGEKSNILNIKVVDETSNYWINKNVTLGTVVYGEDYEPTGATPVYGTVVYKYCDSADGVFTTVKPVDAGTYWVKATVAPTADYIGLETAPVKFEIVQAENEWVEELTVTNGVPSAEAKFGAVVYTYYDAEGNKLDEAPTEAGDYKVVATVAETDNYTGLEAEADYTIEESDQGWVKNEDGTYSYQDGSEWLMNGIYELPIENGSEEKADFWFVDGVMQKGWYENNSDKQYYFSSVSGAMLKNRWVSVDADGNYVDWRTDRDAVADYFYVDAEGKVVKDVFKYDQACTYGGEADGHYYAFAKDGAMLTGFQEHNGKKYYFSPATGIMKTGWAKIDGKWYYFAEDGAMAKNETIDGWYVDADGVWDGK